MDERQLEIRNQESLEILEKTPGWSLLWGNVLILFIVLIGFVFISRVDLSTRITASARLYEKTDSTNAGTPYRYGLMYVSQSEINKVQPGTPIKLQVVGYPEKEYGTLVSKVASLGNEITSDDKVAVTLNINNDLITTNGKKIPMKNGLLSVAQISIKKKNFFRNIFSGF